MALDDIGLGITMCEMARASSGDLVMFNRAGKCFNGRNYVQNQLERHLRLQKRWISNQLKFMTYFETCVNHRNGIMSGTPIDDLLSGICFIFPVETFPFSLEIGVNKHCTFFVGVESVFSEILYLGILG